MKKRKIIVDKKFVLSSAYEEYKYLTEYMVNGQEGNYNKPGVSDYPFYSYFSSLVNKTTILEIGTSSGGSAVMLSHNQTNNIISYDTAPNEALKEIKRKNIEFRTGDFMQDDIDYDSIHLITLDAAHTGSLEVEMFGYLENNWKGGLLFLDDIHNNNNGDMQGFWDGIDDTRHEKIDISNIGHGLNLGSGLVNFNRYYDLKVIGE